MFFLGMDLGTTSLKIIIMGGSGEVVASVTKEYNVYTPHEGWSEQHPEEWWKACKEGIKEIINRSGVKSADIKSIGLSGQMHGLVALDSNGNVLMPAILWNDQRTQDECDYLNKEIGQDKISKYTGNIALTGFTAPKILWVKKHKPDIFDKIRHILLPKDYIRFRLTGEYASEVSDSSGTLIFNVADRQWSNEMINILGIDKSILPVVYESYEVTGKVSKMVSQETGLKEGIPVCGGGGDQAAGAVGTGTVEEGIISVAMGTSGVVFACNHNYSVDTDNRLHSFCHANGKWHQMGVMLSAAACLKWWVDKVHNKIKTEDVYDFLLAESEKTNSNGLIFLPYLTGERTPYPDPYARGSFIGLSSSHGRAEMTRAILEGVCFGLRDSQEILRSLDVPAEEVRVTGGGSKSKLWRQILADVFNAEVEQINSQEGPAYGVAILASVSVGKYKDVAEACKDLIKITDRTQPRKDFINKYNEYYNVYHGLYERLKGTFSDIRKLNIN